MIGLAYVLSPWGSSIERTSGNGSRNVRGTQRSLPPEQPVGPSLRHPRGSRACHSYVHANGQHPGSLQRASMRELDEVFPVPQTREAILAHGLGEIATLAPGSHLSDPNYAARREIKDYAARIERAAGEA